MIELKPCPFCGGQPKMCESGFVVGEEEAANFWVECKECEGATGTWTEVGESIAAWNQRGQAMIEELEGRRLTGIKDMYGTEIREGDIIAFSYGAPVVGVRGPVFFENGKCYVDTAKHNPKRILLKSLKHHVGEYEIVGVANLGNALTAFKEAQ